eukprot:15344266-Ditylum_brightwellii.AAC.1
MCPKSNKKWEDISNILTDVYKKNQVDPILCILLTTHIIKPMTTMQEVQKVYPHINLKPYKRLSQAHKAIGWKQLCYGWWLLEWANYQRRYSQTINKEHEEDTTFPASICQVIQEVWLFQKCQWHLRNAALHNNTQYIA